MSALYEQSGTEKPAVERGWNGEGGRMECDEGTERKADLKQNQVKWKENK